MSDERIDAVLERLRWVRERCTSRVVLLTMAVIAVIAVAIPVVAVWSASAGAGGSPTRESAPPLFEPAPSTSSTAVVLTVHVAGAVRSPGLYRLGAGSRVADAIAAAGGVGESVDIDRVNLAAPVVDGQRVFIARRGEPDPAVEGATAGEDGGPARSGVPLDLNAATESQLEDLPGVGPSTAAAIIEQRRRIGRFRSVDDLLDVRGIGVARLDQLRGLVTVG